MDFEALPHLGLRQFPRVLDVGANRGQAIDSIRLTFPGATITAIEPSKRLADRLAEEYPSVKVIRAAVGNTIGSFDLYTPSYRGFRYDGLASCDEFIARAWFTSSIWRYDPDLVTVEREAVAVVRVDDLDVKADFVKIDVQGMELATVRGMEQMLACQRPVVMIETPCPETRAVLEGLGYRTRYWVSGHLTTARPLHPSIVFFLP
jgi:FkbM family methyltransferase